MNITQHGFIRYSTAARSAENRRRGPSWVDVLLTVSLFVVVVWLGVKAAGAL